MARREPRSVPHRAPMRGRWRPPRLRGARWEASVWDDSRKEEPRNADSPVVALGSILHALDHGPRLNPRGDALRWAPGPGIQAHAAPGRPVWGQGPLGRLPRVAQSEPRHAARDAAGPAGPRRLGPEPSHRRVAQGRSPAGC